MKTCILPAITLLACGSFLQADSPTTPPAGADFFETKVRPVLVEHCYSCHGPKRQQAGLRLDNPTDLRKGSDTGSVLTPGNPDASSLIQVIRYGGEIKMPPKGKLPGPAVEALTQWVKLGAPWPETTHAVAANRPVAEVKKHWAFQPVREPSLPEVKHTGWLQTPVDAFVLAKLEANGLTPAEAAGRHALIRRVTFDLTGLPPTAAEIAAFVNDRAPDAFARVVDRLLASPHYGERWARHWLDVARYADTKGYVFQEERRYPYAYTYRDYVIRAFNEDLPYNQFILEQLAADKLPLGADKRPLAAMGYLTLGRRFLNNIHDIIDDRIDVVSRGLLGLTVGCARCHDHKYDPIPTRDYYSLHGVFASSVEPGDLPLIEEPVKSAAYQQFEKELQQREQRVTEFLQKKHGEAIARYRQQVGAYLFAAQTMSERMLEGNRNLTAGDVVPTVVRRWQGFLKLTRTPDHVVFAPWHALAALPAGEFVARSKAMQQQFEENQRINPLVRLALTERPLTSLKDAAERYGELFKQVEQQWQDLVKQDPANASRALPDPAAEELRQILYRPESPVNIELTDQRAFLDRAGRNELNQLRQKIDQFKVSSPAAPARAMVLADSNRIQDSRILLRGNPNNQGDVVPRQFLSVLSGEKREPFRDGSGRLELARAIANPDNPLTARVFVNRVWLHHFGVALVRTPSDFGLRSEAPTHPELLDWLAARFMASGWSVKQLHRVILLSNTYQLSSIPTPAQLERDPENRLLGHMNRRRLDFEQLRDALLSVSGRLEPMQGGRAADITTAPFSGRRSIYGFIDRQNLPGLFRTFDFASPDTSTPQRHQTTVPQQALFLMNSPFVLEQARRLTERTVPHASRDSRLKDLYRRIYGRSPTEEEQTLGQHYLASADYAEEAWTHYVQVLLLANEFAFLD